MGYIQALVEENEQLKNRVHNLNLYLDYLREAVVDPDKWAEFEDKFWGLAGYTNDSLWEREQCE